MIKELDTFRKTRFESFKEKKKEYERQTIKYCSTAEKSLEKSFLASRKEKAHEEEVKEADRVMRDENNAFYVKCLDYVYSIQEFEYDWFSYFSGNILQYVQSWMNFYHESYEKHVDCEIRIGKSKQGLSKLTQRVDEIKVGSMQIKQKALKHPNFSMNSYQVWSPEHCLNTSKQGYLYFLEKSKIIIFCKCPNIVI